MQLESALHSSREGLNAHGQAISVVGDNISNASTTGYKRSRTEFADLFVNEITTPGDPDGVGSGAAVATVRQIHEEGVIEQTGRNLDAGIDGEGFFIVTDGTDSFYTRAGNFSVNPEGKLVDGSGREVLGYAPGATTELSSINMLNVGVTGRETKAITLTGNLDAKSPIGAPPTTPDSSEDLIAPGAATFVNLVTVYDSLGIAHSVSVAFTKTDVLAKKWTAQAFIDGGEVTGGTKGKPVLIGSYDNLTFSSGGVIDAAAEATANIPVTNVAYANGAAAGSFSISVGGFTQFSGTSLINSVTNDGLGVGDISSYEIRSNGAVVANLSSGVTKTLGTLALARFTNVDGLSRAGDVSFSQTNEAGTRTEAVAGSAGNGKIQGGGLEHANVDIAQEFVDLIVYQRAYQANSQMLNAASTLIKDTISLIR